MNLYIISNVLWDATRGMCVIAAESMSHCEGHLINRHKGT
jgi:hypothetical protein